MSRTFQHVKMIPELTVLENVALGAQLRGSKDALSSMLRLDRHEEQSLLREAARQLERIGMGHAHARASWQPGHGPATPAGNCPCTVQRPGFAAAGRTRRRPAPQGKTGAGRRAAPAAREGMSILLVEHDMDLVMDVTDHIVVMEFGTKLMEGTPEEVQQSPKVRAAYLGMEH
jgi:branched-chain amino acid transport system permease protein